MVHSRPIMRAFAGVLMLASAVGAQTPPDAPQPRPLATMKQLMVDLVHPASNALLLLINRGGPGDDREWAEARHAALTLAESGNLLMTANRAPAWVTDARLLMDAGAAAYKAADAKDARALAEVADRVDASCTTCHKQFRPGIFPPAR